MFIRPIRYMNNKHVINGLKAIRARLRPDKTEILNKKVLKIGA